ncbi:hypothetical protein ACTFIZ_010784 [Dictyostelium cf. discoideum]
MIPNDQFETLQKYLLAVGPNDLCNVLSLSDYDIVFTLVHRVCMEFKERGRAFEVGSLSIGYVSKLTDKIRSHCVFQILSRLEKPIKCCIYKEYNDDLFNDIFFNENPNTIPTPSNPPTQPLQSSHSNLSFITPNQEQYFNIQDQLDKINSK